MFAIDHKLPDLTLLFNLSPEEGLARINKNKDREVNRLDLEKLEFHHDVQKEYLALANEYKDRIIVIDASKSLEEVCEEAYKVIKGFLDR